MTQEYYIKRGIEKFKALDDKTQTDLIDYLTLKVVACGFIKSYAPKNSLHGMKIPEGIQVVGVTTVGEVLKKVFS